VICEIGATQADVVVSCVAAAGLRDPQVRADLAGLARVAMGRRA
jgi:hypothetical protein